MKKNNKIFFLNQAYKSGLMRSFHLFDPIYTSSVYVLVYHRVDWKDSQPRLDPMNLSATPDQFNQHMRLISSEYNPVSPELVLEAVLHKKKLPSRAVLVTVDDGYYDFKKHIWPIAKSYGIRPLLFIPTAYVGTGVFWWDQLYDALQRTSLKQIETPVGLLPLVSLSERQQTFLQIAQYIKKSPFNNALAVLINLCQELVSDPYVKDQITLNWDDLRELSKDGVVIAPHTHTHPALGNIDVEQVHIEISKSQSLIKTEIGSNYPLFAYPYGSKKAIGTIAGEVLRDRGYQIAFTMNPGRAHLNHDDRMYTPRIDSSPHLTISQFYARLSPIYDFVTRIKKAKL